MPTVNYYLKKAEANSNLQLIYLQFKYSGQKFVYSFGQKIDPANWSAVKQRVKNNKQTTTDGQYSLNDLLEILSATCVKAYTEELKNGVPAKAVLKSHLDKFFYKNLEEVETEKVTLYKLIDRFIAGEIQHKGNEKSRGSLNNYRSTKKHLLEFQKKRAYQVDFETINLDFFYHYTSFLKNTLKLSQNTRAKDITILKVFMAEAIDLEYTANLQFKHKKFTVETVETEAIFLTEKEILNLYHHDFSGHKKLEQVRDLFVVGCFTGLRYSDYSNIRKENIVQREGEYFIKMNTQKTGELVIIPCNPVVVTIFAKYESNVNRLPRSLSNQKFNDYIKEACKAAGFNETGRLTTSPDEELWQNVTSHTARRSFATNLFMEGFPTIDLMKITGHKTEKSFLKYIRVTKLDTANRLAAFNKKKDWSRLMLKVAS